jgi:hypothetical protein
VQALHDLMRFFCIFTMTVANNDERGAQAQGATHGHRRANSKGASGIRARSHDTPFFRASANRKGFASQGWVIQLFNSAEERIQVQVQNGAHLMIPAQTGQKSVRFLEAHSVNHHFSG